MQSTAPVVIFAFNRPDHLRLTLESLAQNDLADSTMVFIYCDGPRNSEEKIKTDKVRSVANSAHGFKHLKVIESPSNKGLAPSVISGVTEVCTEYGRVIVLEDDMVTSPYFLTFMNEGLEKLKDNHNVISIHGYVYPLEKSLEDAFFLKGADCWGWATWKRGWDLFESNGELLLQELKKRKLLNRFNFDGTYKFEKMLRDFIAGKNSSWAVRWYASALLADKLTLYPSVSLVNNIGLDSSGTHCSSESAFEVQLASKRIEIPDAPQEENHLAYKLFCKFFLSQKGTREKVIIYWKRIFS